MWAVRVCYPICFWLMTFSPVVRGQQTTDLAKHIRAISTYYAAHYARQYSVPLQLVEAIIEVESGWRPEVVSSKGAVGLMQLMPVTGRRFEVRNRFNIEQNIRGGVSYLAWLCELFKGDLRLVAAAYLAGERRISERGLAYSNPQVSSYVNQVARLYRRNRQINRSRK
jgi:soluble lytic murein transglycosylase-like protein